jgi:DNA polymerase bacteriophage-type
MSEEKTLLGDLETYCETPLRDGTWRYAQSAHIMLWCYAVSVETDDPVFVWDILNDELHTYYPSVDDWEVEPCRAMPDNLFGALTDKSVAIEFHNAGFDRPVLLHAGSVVERAAAQDLKRWRCTMARGLAHSLPGALAAQGEVLQTADATRKLDGKDLVHLFCKPRPANQKLRRATKATHPDEWLKFVRYGARDIVAMRANRKRMPAWNYQGRELDLWHLDQKINQRGMCIDMGLVDAAIRAADRAKAALAERAQELTDGELQATTQRDALLKHLLAEYGVDLPDMQMSTLERRIEDPALPWAVKELLQNRLQASSTSVAKYNTLLRGTSSDGRLRGTLQFAGASRTGRWAGRLFQPQNLPSRGLLPQDEIDFGIEAMLNDCEHLLFDNVMHVCVSAIRGAIVAPPGKKLVCADLSNIEGRDQAWLAGEQWKLQAFREYDAGTGPDLYKWAFSKAFNIPLDQVDKAMRQIGKVMELAFGYEGGVGAWVTFALAYDIDLEDLARRVFDTLPADLREEAQGFLQWSRDQKRSTFGLSDQAFVTCDALKRGWRRGHGAISAYWKQLAETVREAINAPGVTLVCGKLKVRRDGAWLRLVLPSGRALCYPHPQVGDGGEITYMGINQYSRKWQRLKTYGGKLFENVCQAVARDVMAWNMPAIEAAGFEIVTTVHDEVVCEAPDTDEFTGERLAALLCATPPWAAGMPLAAEGFEAKRYRK